MTSERCLAVDWLPVATAVVLGLIVIIGFVILCLCAKLCFKDGNYRKGGVDVPRKPTLIRYWKHEHSLLGVLWQKPPYPTNQVELDRKRKVMLLALMFFLNFMVIGFISLFTPSFPSCAQARDAMENARLDRAGPNYIPFLVGYNRDLRSYRYDDSGSAAFTKYKARAQSANVGVAEERPCWEYCRSANATVPTRDFISRLLIFSRTLVDNRLECDQVLNDALRSSLVCYDYRWKGDDTCDSSILVSLSSTEFILRGILVVFVVLPIVVVYKRLLRCTESDHTPCIGQFFAYPFIIIIFVISFILAWVLAVSLQGEVVGDFTISFLFSFLLSLLFEFPKLGFFYIMYKGKRLERVYLEATGRHMENGVLVVDSLTSSSSAQSVFDLEAFEADHGKVNDNGSATVVLRQAPGFQSPYANNQQQSQYRPPPGQPYGAPPVMSPYPGADPGYGAAPPGAPYGAPHPYAATSGAYGAPVPGAPYGAPMYGRR
ncbi:uncharacterized protein AMSG_08214 [Thecamonas trahens ATCC 50062]|uniref:Uncharacterized protein n=1 Tax=Thecamonas trahens ATCC 50062 TaxID=461836 RepID=A0A0L0DIN1_THETB|nr:hypothetical protein AMSG_08214 [Thecamonas trahens ATCC 50062]KNC51966.1 hypothetical protein AMSG_08214 [Thecamonas trahens ATCC 50062]|eukprot:XP_013755553.1 hypothetical protein AMSG_08214 [Thecamonas trahens ATCC 50062]